MKDFPIAIRRLMKEHQMIQKSPVESIYPVPDPKNILEWHFIIYGLKNCPYEGGYYYGKLTFPIQYPNKPPSLIFITPNGRFQTEETICMSFTNYHPESWSTSWTVENMLIGLISFMNTNEITKGSIKTSDSEKRKLAAESIGFNLKHPGFVRVFKPHFSTLGINQETVKTSQETLTEVIIEKEEAKKKHLFFVIAFIVMIISYALFKALSLN